jgi:hypothetical protein
VTVIVLIAVGCTSAPPERVPSVSAESVAGMPKMPFVELSENRSGFALKSGEAFVPWGFNYHNAGLGQLIEDYWEDEGSWSVTADDFAEVRDLGANVLRIHLQFAAFMNGPGDPDEAQLGRLRRLVDLAEAHGLYLDLTGLGAYRKTDQPDWYDTLDERARWAAQASFWEAVAQTVADSPAIFAYNLMNEPVVPGEPTTSWLPGEGIDDLFFVQHITREPAGRAWPDVMRAWIRTLTDAIRQHDDRHLITVGFLPLAGFAQLAPALDYLSVHVYPKEGEIDRSLDVVADFAEAGVPVVVEETFLLNIGAAGEEDFLLGSRASASGWIGFYWGATPEELASSPAIGDALMRAWLELFVKLGPAMRSSCAGT